MQVKNLIMFYAFVSLILVSCNPQKKLAREKHEYMQSTYADIKKAIPDAEVTILNDTLKVLFPENLLFQKGGASINDSIYPIMQRFANALIVHNKTDVLINGHTDSTGSVELNQKLSQARADSAADVLKLYKVPDTRLKQWGFGSRQPIADNATEEGRKRNRRVEFIILYAVAGN